MTTTPCWSTRPRGFHLNEEPFRDVYPIQPIAEWRRRGTHAQSHRRGSHVSKSMWPYAARLDIDVLSNIMSDSVPGGVSQRQVLLEHIGGEPYPQPPLVSTVRRSRVHIPAEQCAESAKFDEGSTKMYYVGRVVSRIYLIWDPAAEKVYLTSSVKWVKHSLPQRRCDRTFHN